MTSGALMNANQKRIASFALKSRLPSVYGRREEVDAGGLMSYSADLVDSYRRAAYFVDRILKGAKPADLPVEQPTKFELAINLKTAKQIGLTIPQSVLLFTYGITSTMLSLRLFPAVIWIEWFCRNSSASSRAATVST